MNKSTKRIIVEVSLYEASMLKKLRQDQFGQFTVHKVEGEPMRITIGGSEMLKEDDGLDMQISSSFGKPS
jgi:hypothetical protein